MVEHLFDFAVATIFAREFLEGAIIMGEYRMIVLRGDSLQPGVCKDDALREIYKAALFGAIFALLVIAVIATVLGILSNSFDSTVSNIIEGISKIVAAICLLGLALKLPRWLGVLGSSKKKPENGDEESEGLTLRSIRFNVAWNIWREVAECGVFLVPFFLSGDGLVAVPLSAAIGSIIGLLCGLGIYWANKKFTNKLGLTIFAVLLLVSISAGLFSGGCHKLETEMGKTTEVWEINGKFWSAERLPMTILKPFGYSDTRTVLQIASYWSWLALCAVLFYRKVRMSPKVGRELNETEDEESDDTGSQLDVEGGPLKDDLLEDGMHPHEETKASSSEQIECTFAGNSTTAQKLEE
jgi:high-affinity iron transporter